MASGVDRKWGAWHTVRALDSWQAELTKAFPKRKRPDGTIADHLHTRPSGHIPDADGEVTAADVYPQGTNPQSAISAFRNDRHGRSRYVIYKQTIWTRSGGWRPQSYTGAYHNHMHFEVYGESRGRDARPWGLYVPAGAARPPTSKAPGARPLRLTRPYMRGVDVGFVQRFLGAKWAGPDDGVYGPKTERGVRRYQAMRGLPVTGIVDTRTWAHIRGK